MKKFISLVLAVLMLVSVVPLSCASAVSQIPSDAVKFNGHYYKVFPQSMTWQNAQEYSKNLGGHLVTITSKEENDFVLSLIETSDKAYNYLIGLAEINGEGTWSWVTGEELSYKNWAQGQPDNDKSTTTKGQNVCAIVSANTTYGFSAGQWDDVSSFENGIYSFICEWDEIYNLGEETYGFRNYVDRDAKRGHCFGMSVTSSGYYLGFLDPTDVGMNSSKEVYTLSDNNTVRKPICYYQPLQGRLANSANVAGGTNYKNNKKFDIESDWNEIVNYVKNHEYDDRGNLQIDYRTVKINTNEVVYGHAINFLYYDEQNERIVAYDNRLPDYYVFIWKDDNGHVRCGGDRDTLTIGSIVLRDVSAYFSAVEEKETIDRYLRYAVYSVNGNIMIVDAISYLLSTGDEDNLSYVHEIPEAQTTVKITPLVDNASFMYMGKEYSFGEIDEDTYAELTLSTDEEETPEFTIVNAPEVEPEGPEAPAEPSPPTKDCNCDCHKGGIAGFFWKILNFFYKLFKINKECSCGVSHY